MKSCIAMHWLMVGAIAAFVLLGASSGARTATPATGPLRVHPANPRYFTDGTVTADGVPTAVFLVGSHTWNSLVDMGRNDPPEPFDFTAYLDFLEERGHNFVRLWAWDSTSWDTRANGSLGKDFVHHAAPLPWARTGPELALDGKPRFDLERFNPDYFTRLRERVSAAGQRGIYVSVMLFEGWGLMHGNRRKGTVESWAWRTHPFHPENNVNGVNADEDGDPLTGEVHHLGDQAVNDVQRAYIRKVVDTVNDLDNVLYEVINEGGRQSWDWWVVQEIQSYEQTKPRRHPVGITGHGAERLKSMLASPADWVSPGRADGFAEDPPAWNEKKVSLLDTDHIWGVGGNAHWVWKSMTRGHNPIFMDPYDDSVLGVPGGADWEPLRRALGHAAQLAGSVDLGRMAPHDLLASTGYCLADPGREYVIFVPEGDTVTVDLREAAGDFRLEWIHPVRGDGQSGDMVPGGGQREFSAPYADGAVLYLRRIE
jgi:hypothetical protein